MSILKNVFGEPEFAMEAEAIEGGSSVPFTIPEPEAAVPSTVVEAETPPQVSVTTASSADSIQALIDAALAKTTPKEVSEQSDSGSGTFATDYLVIPATQGRRRPGPSLDTFKDMAVTMRR